jgi:hypothetical protein
LQTTLNEISDDQVILTIEDTPELQLSSFLGGGLKTRPKAGGTSDEFQVVNMTSLLKASLRMRPNWIVCGEIRDSSDPNNSPADTFISSIQSDHRGACTIHAPDGYGAFMRFQAMLANARPSAKEESIRMALGESIRLVVVLERVNETILDERGNQVLVTRRRVKEMMECLGSDGHDYFMNPLFRTRMTQKPFVDPAGNFHTFPFRHLEMVGIPFFGLELEDIGHPMPSWWVRAKVEHASKLRPVGRAAYASDLLGAAQVGAEPFVSGHSLDRRA